MPLIYSSPISGMRFGFEWKGNHNLFCDDEELFRYTLAGGEGDGHFGLRLLQNHVLFTDFKATIL